MEKFEEGQNTIKSSTGGTIMANVELATAPTSEMKRSIRGMEKASRKVNMTSTDRNMFSSKSSRRFEFELDSKLELFSNDCKYLLDLFKYAQIIFAAT